MEFAIDYAETRRAAHLLDRHAHDIQDRASPREPDLGPPDDPPAEGHLADLGRSAVDLALRLSRLSAALDAVEERATGVDDQYAAYLRMLEVR
jgi:hypothetical protein